MCIAILNNGKKITRQELSNCWVSNDDGAGMLYIDNGKLAVFKQPNRDGYNVSGRDFDTFVKEYDRVYKMSKDLSMPILIHFRIATHGLDPAYLHPFLVSDNVGLIHNGIIYGYGTRDISDTYEFTAELATLPESLTRNVEFLDNQFISNAILDKLDSSNKVVFMDNTGDYRVFNAQLGHWSNGNWFSNDAYKTRTTYFGSVAGTNLTPTKPKTYSWEEDLDLLDEKSWNDSFGVKNTYDETTNDDWYGFGKSAYKPLEFGVPFSEEFTYHCTSCPTEVFVDEDACCVTCGQYIPDSEADVIKALISGEETQERGLIIKPANLTPMLDRKTTYMY